MTDPFGGYPSRHKEQREEQDNAVPTGTSKEILDWVGEDQDRASRALAIEQADEEPRKTLVTALKKLV